MNVLDHVDMMTVLGQDLQEVAAMAEVIVRTAMMMTGTETETDMTGQIEEEIAMNIVTMNIIQWYV